MVWWPTPILQATTVAQRDRARRWPLNLIPAVFGPAMAGADDRHRPVLLVVAAGALWMAARLLGGHQVIRRAGAARGDFDRCVVVDRFAAVSAADAGRGGGGARGAAAAAGASVAGARAGFAVRSYLGISLWVIPDVAARGILPCPSGDAVRKRGGAWWRRCWRQCVLCSLPSSYSAAIRRSAGEDMARYAAPRAAVDCPAPALRYSRPGIADDRPDMGAADRNE